MSNFLFALTAGAVVLGIMVLLHEYGHFIAAKLCSVRVDVFSVGFGPRIWGMRRGDTDYRISALPLGGYVRMAGENPAEERTGEPYEFLSRPRWQRFIIAIAGPAANILLTFLILFGILLFMGVPTEQYVTKPPVVAAMPQNADASGVKAGDQILKVDGAATPTWQAALTKVAKAKPGSVVSVVVLRQGATVTLNIPVPNGAVDAEGIIGYPAVAPILDEVQEGYPAEKAGLRASDRVLSVNGKSIVTRPQIGEIVRQSGGQPVHLVVERQGKELSFNVTPRHAATSEGPTWMIGAIYQSDQIFEHEGFFSALADGAISTVNMSRMIGDVVAGLFRGKISVRDLAGPVGIVQMSGEAARLGPLTLLNWMAYISLNLAFLNLLPIPILDGGHVLLLAIEGTLRRDLSLATKERFVQVGLVFLLGVFAFVMYSDILRLFQH
jgi:regulator of sigma E protease